MCGRYQLEFGIEQLMLRFDAYNRYIGYGTKHEVFPTDMVAMITRNGSQNFLDAAKWGFDNHYDKRPLINARGETVEEKKTFKSLFTQSRCIIPATAFYEWRRNSDNSKTKMQISIDGMPVFGMAGLYKAEIDVLGNTVLRCTIITTSASPAMADIHDRMPVILSPYIENTWLDNTITDASMLKGFLIPYPGDLKLLAVS